jgi:hypothetical protein
MWQDIIISAGGVFFTVALIPSLIGKNKPAVGTSVPTSIILFVMILTYASLGLWMSAVMNAVMCFLWAVLAFQQITINRKTK